MSKTQKRNERKNNKAANIKRSIEQKKKETVETRNNHTASDALIVRYMLGHLDINSEDIFFDLIRKYKTLGKSGIKVIERMLFSSAHSLQAIYERAAILSTAPDNNIQAIQVWNNIALKAQHHRRQALVDLANIINPRKTAFIKQQNNAINQQVNNSCQTTDSKISENFLEKKSKSTNELLSEVQHETLDIGRTRESVPINSQLETMEAINGSKDSSRKGKK